MSTDQLRATRGQSVSEQMATDLRESIAQGDYQPGDLIPSARDLMETWGVAKMTANRAVARLKSAGLVETVPGRGLVVLGRRAGVEPAAQFHRMQTVGRIRLPNERSEILQTGEVGAETVDPVIVAAIGQTIESGATLYRRRLIYRDERPLCMATSWFGATVLSGGRARQWDAVRDRLLSHEPIPEGTPRLIAELVEEDPVREDYSASAEAASVMEADALGMPVGAPVLRLITTMHGESWPLETGVYTYPAGVACAFPSAEYRF